MTIKYKLAKTIFERDNYTCQYCLRQFTRDQPQLHIHHRVFTSQGGDESPINLVSCCWECHHTHGKLKGAKTAQEIDYTTIEALTKYYMRIK